MDFKALLTGKNRIEIEAIADNWYARLNRLKEKYGQPYEGIANDKARNLIFELIGRVQPMMMIIARLSQPIPKYPEGGGNTIIGETGLEIISRGNPTH